MAKQNEMKKAATAMADLFTPEEHKETEKETEMEEEKSSSLIEFLNSHAQNITQPSKEEQMPSYINEGSR